MSAFIGWVLTFLHVIGGIITGYYAYALRIMHETTPLTQDAVLGFLAETPWAVVGIILTLFAIVWHLSQIGGAKRRVGKEHAQVVALDIEKAALQAEIDRRQELFDFCEAAILKSAKEERVEQPLDYAQSDFELPPVTDESN